MSKGRSAHRKWCLVCLYKVYAPEGVVRDSKVLVFTVGVLLCAPTFVAVAISGSGGAVPPALFVKGGRARPSQHGS